MWETFDIHPTPKRTGDVDAKGRPDVIEDDRLKKVRAPGVHLKLFFACPNGKTWKLVTYQINNPLSNLG